MINFCTLFDHNYLSRGLVMCESLKAHCSEDFTLYILTTDDIAYKWLCANPHENIIVNSLADIKDAYPVLTRLEAERTKTEFNWTLSSFSIQFFLKKYNLPSITYLDADIYFYEDPQVLFDELNENESVIITPHNYTPQHDSSATSGRYCVQFMYFKNNNDGNKVLEWWRNECEKCCCQKLTDGKFGDQKYLDDWLSRFPSIVHEEKHQGCGVALWNIEQFDFEQKDNAFYIINKITKQKSKLIFFHFHALREFITKNKSIVWRINSYELSYFVRKKLYTPYTKKLEELSKKLPEKKITSIKLPRKNTFRCILSTFKQTIIMLIKALSIHQTYKRLSKEYKQFKNGFIIN